MLLYFLLFVTFSTALKESCPNYVCYKRETCCGSPVEWTCCPYSDGICCDDETCCPKGTVCDEDGLSCRTVKNIQRLRRRQGFAASETEDDEQAEDYVHCGDMMYCAEDNTCCELGTGHFGCCPYKSAVCCPDQLYCCPEGMLCDLESKTCLSPNDHSELI